MFPCPLKPYDLKKSRYNKERITAVEGTVDQATDVHIFFMKGA